MPPRRVTLTFDNGPTAGITERVLEILERHGIRSTFFAIGELSHPNKLFRPYGNSGLIGRHLLSRAAIAYLLANRFQTVLWNSVPGDWRDAAGWGETCIAQVLENEWSVGVLHDID